MLSFITVITFFCRLILVKIIQVACHIHRKEKPLDHVSLPYNPVVRFFCTFLWKTFPSAHQKTAAKQIRDVTTPQYSSV